MSPKTKAILKLLVLVAVMALLFFFYPVALGFVEGTARNLRQLWWLILLIALACWLIWGVGRKERK